jgi:glycerol uptake facilitator-like aquaporin
MWKSLASEYFGTLLLISVISMIGNPLAIAGALWVAIILVGKYSGGHFNPAVTLMTLLKGKINSQLAIGYVLAQLAAAVTVWKLA